MWSKKLNSVIALMVLILTSCRLMGSALAPIEHTRQDLGRDHPNATNIQVLGSRQNPQGEVAVIYTLTEPSGDGRPMFITGVSVYRQAPLGGWQQAGGGGSGSSEPPAQGQILDYFSTQGAGTSIYGRVLSPEVGSVEARLSNGEINQDPADDGAFAIFAPEGVKICSLSALGASGQVLDVHDFTSDDPEDLCQK